MIELKGCLIGKQYTFELRFNRSMIELKENEEQSTPQRKARFNRSMIELKVLRFQVAPFLDRVIQSVYDRIERRLMKRHNSKYTGIQSVYDRIERRL